MKSLNPTAFENTFRNEPQLASLCAWTEDGTNMANLRHEYNYIGKVMMKKLIILKQLKL